MAMHVEIMNIVSKFLVINSMLGKLGSNHSFQTKVTHYQAR